MSEIEKLAAWAAEALNGLTKELDGNCGCVPHHWSSDPAWTPESVLQAAGVPSLQEQVQDLAQKIIMSRAQVLEKFVADYSANPETNALLFTDLEPEVDEISASYVSVVPQAILTEKITPEIAAKYPTIRLSIASITK